MNTQNKTIHDGSTMLPMTLHAFTPIAFHSEWVPASTDPRAITSPELEYELEKMAFDQQYPELRITHNGQYVAIHNGKVVEVGPTEADVTRRFFAKFPNGHVYIGYVGDAEPPTYQISPISAPE